MLESLALSLAKTLVTFLFKQYLESQAYVKIEGAPGWYYKEGRQEICAFAHETGGYGSLDAAKAKAKGKMVVKINKIIEVVIYDNYRNLKDEKEKKFVQSFAQDKELPIFVNRTVKFSNVEYRQKIRTAFVKACMDKNELIDYQKERLEKIKYSLTHKRADDAFEELDNSFD